MAQGLMRVLLVGFGPFPGIPRNPSADLVKRLAKRRRPALASVLRSTHIFATAYAAVDNELPILLDGKPDIVLMFGLAARRRQLCIETQARNARSILFPDVRGYHPARGLSSLGEEAGGRSNAPCGPLVAAGG